jgi:RNA polymerase sigma-70 factor, ECF subfamily
VVPLTISNDPARLLAAARRGEESAFGELVEPHRRDLHLLCYRMLGSLQDADDALQDALLKAWLGLEGFRGDSALSTWLHRIATNVCLDAIRARPRRILPADFGPAEEPGDAEHGAPISEPIWVDPYPDELGRIEEGYASPEANYEHREAVELAFIAALQRLPARQRAVLILRDVLGFSAKETGATLETTPASVNGLLQRARASLDADLPERSQQQTMRAIGDRAVRDVVTRFTQALEAGEVGTILDLLTDDVAFAMPPYPQWYRGRSAVADSWLMPGPPPTGLRCVETRANGQVALAAYSLADGGGQLLAIALDVLTLRDDRIAAIHAFRDPGVLASFGLPAQLPV